MAQVITSASIAMRLARTIASDILLYNQDEVAEGLQNDDLFERLADQLAEGRQHFEERTDRALREKHNFFERALVDVLIQRSVHLPSSCW